ncbi:P-loop containing nucleoside triphosphate hydrolase protein [Lactarius akahatsu]|uniref:ATP-dependent DNA helicase n=1 Tax=Lactarius akahatsu TaxID=416441 RepID=A0AAD4QDS6_9AGAM|nr:P-loop containing nucleoside triphosphate hydrolase protein [Lactarius akahatsu]
MSSPNSYWGDEELNSAVLNELAVIEATQIASTSRPVVRSPPKTVPPLAKQDSDDLFDLAFDVDAQDLQELDAAIEKDYRRKAAPSSSNTFGRSLSGRQTTLFGGIVPPRSPSPKKPPSSRRGAQQKSPSHPTDRKVKKWDHTAFAKTGAKRKTGKRKAKDLDEDGDEDDAVEFEQFPCTFCSQFTISLAGTYGTCFILYFRPPPPMKLQPDLLAAQRWIFPLNRPKRDYQFNISRNCLFDNALVALPTGLGKTFIAGVVMLNFYRWFPEGKVVFVAPTKPLVAQQVEACHKTCGIPGSDAIELTGNNPRSFRAKAWQEKRVFYMTPQTFENDLKTDNCDPRDVILLVMRHTKGQGTTPTPKLSGSLWPKIPHFRLLALTATPGGTPDAVQAIVDSLHIGRIELRDEQSLDIRSYVYEKKVKQHIVSMNEGIATLRDLLAKVLEVYIKKCTAFGILRGNLDPVMFHPFRANAAMDEINRRPDSRQLQWAYPVLRKVGALARAMGYLLEASPQMCFRSLTEEAEGATSDKPSGLNKDPAFQTLMTELRLQKSSGFAVHPKLEMLKTLVVDHFGQRLRDENASDADVRVGEDTRAMVFVTFREAVDEIVDFLNQDSPLLRANKFIGQGIDKKGNKGLAQREQLDIINQFKDGVFNILVATSVGEEGLDIGEVDLIVCYDAQKTPIRMLQRVGRTGRKREGYVHVLLAEGREETNWNKAREAYNQVQRTIVRGDQLELYDDTERLLPDHIKPECLEMVMEIQEYDRAATERSREKTTKGPSNKRKRNDNPARDIPPGACTGFVSVADLLVKQKNGKKRQKATKFDENAGIDDDTDEEIEAGLFAPRRSTSMSAASSKPPKTKLKRSKTTASGSKKRKPAAPKRKRVRADDTELTASQFAREGAEDSDDKEIERGLQSTSVLRPSKSPALVPSGSSRASSPEVPLVQNQSIIDICTSAAPSRSPSPRHATPQPSADANDLAPQHVPPSPAKSGSAPQDRIIDLNEDECEPSKEEDSLAWLLADSEDGETMESGPSKPWTRTSKSPDSDVIAVEDSEHEDESAIVLISSPTRPSTGRPTHEASPPAISPPPPRLVAQRPPPFTAIAESSSPAHPPLSQRRLHRREPHSSPSLPPAKKRRVPKVKVRDTAAAARINPWIDVEATHSGDEVGGGSSSEATPSEDEEEESEGDMRFVTELPPTQASPSYDQSAVYRQSLLSQAPAAPFSVPAFAAPPVRRGGVRGLLRAAAPAAAGPAVVLTSSPPQPREEEDYYMLGSFVVDDEAEISIMQSSEP